eukprot:TRINITY_DN6451_c0_g1_i1.p1 TRINITY_DN6451_c0_g1~~TRINITY_DN6451_c0_g1_i1.p1  ORF type:complete len:208 (-),score=51.43 TRINITY_DN6451_c0_g1_i1:194-817(-)
MVMVMVMLLLLCRVLMVFTVAQDPNAPKRPPSSYLLYAHATREEAKALLMTEQGTARAPLVLARLGDMWNKLSPAQKKPYDDQAKLMNEQYHREMELYNKTHPKYTPPQESDSDSDATSKKKKKKSKKDPNAPKKAATAYICFVEEHRKEVCEELKKLPDFKQGMVLTKLGQMWKELPEDAKTKYKLLSAADRERNEKEKEAYLKSK